jgi:hypothetical protein
MTTFMIHAAKTQLSKLIERAKAGEEVSSPVATSPWSACRSPRGNRLNQGAGKCRPRVF